jgi:hypothetical protein
MKKIAMLVGLVALAGCSVGVQGLEKVDAEPPTYCETVGNCPKGDPCNEPAVRSEYGPSAPADETCHEIAPGAMSACDQTDGRHSDFAVDNIFCCCY